MVIDVYDAEDRQLDSRVETTSETLVGFDDDLPGVVARVVLSARTPLRGEVEIGAIGKGDWEITVGDTTVGLELVSGGGIGAEMLSPPSGSRVIEIGDDDLVTAILTLAPHDSDDPMPPVANLGLILRPVPDHVPDVLDRAATAAAEVDVAVVVVGLTEEQETEAVDKSTMALPGEQDALVSAVAAVARRTVVVVNAATPVLMPWADEVDAILWAGLPGQEAGHAIAAALLGTIEPTGRLVTSFPAADGAAPAWDVVPSGWRAVLRRGNLHRLPRLLRRAGGPARVLVRARSGLQHLVLRGARSDRRRRGTRGLHPGDQHRRPHQPRGRSGLPGPGRGRRARTPGGLGGRHPGRGRLRRG